MEFETLPRAPGQPIAEDGAPWLLFLRPGCALHPGALPALEQAVASRPNAAGFALRQLPCRKVHHYDPATLEAELITGAGLAVRRAAYLAAGGFDPLLQGEAADADLSWRLRATGARLYAAPGAVVLCPDGDAPTMEGATGEALGRLLLAWKYGGGARATAAYWAGQKGLPHFPGVRRRYLENLAKSIGPALRLLAGRGRVPLGARPLAKTGFTAPLAPLRGPDELTAPFTGGPAISVVVRTHARPGRLRGALQSVANQTLPAFEVVVVEDGEATARQMIEAEFSHLPLRYHPTGQHVGRGRAGNLGMGLARGEYITLLDDDDYLYPDHLEQLAARAAAHPEADVVLGCAMVMRVEQESNEPYRHAVRQVLPMRFDRLDLFTMAQQCQIPLSAGLFKKSLFESCGGFSEGYDANEDWAMWLRFLARGKRIDPQHVDVALATSAFVQPADEALNEKRLAAYHAHDAAFFSDPTLKFEVSLRQLRSYYDGMLADVCHLQRLGLLDDFLEREARREAQSETPQP